MEDLIKALKILLKYDNPKWPTHCEHDTLYVAVDPDLVSEDDKVTLEGLGFIVSEEYPEMFLSHRYGSN